MSENYKIKSIYYVAILLLITSCSRLQHNSNPSSNIAIEKVKKGHRRTLSSRYDNKPPEIANNNLPASGEEIRKVMDK